MAVSDVMVQHILGEEAGWAVYLVHQVVRPEPFDRVTQAYEQSGLGKPRRKADGNLLVIEVTRRCLASDRLFPEPARVLVLGRRDVKCGVRALAEIVHLLGATETDLRVLASQGK